MRMEIAPLAFLTTLALTMPALAQQATAPAADPHAGHGAMTATPAPAASGSPPAATTTLTAPAVAPAPPTAPTVVAPAPPAARGMMGHGGMAADRDRDGVPDAHEAHGAAGAGGMAHGKGMGGCKMMGGKGGMMGGHAAHGAGADDEAFHRDLLARIDRLENRLILMETLLRERLRSP